MRTRDGKGKYKPDQTLAAMRSLEGEIKGLFIWAKRDSWTHTRILEERERRVFKSYHWPRLPGWAQGELKRYFAAYSDALYSFEQIRWQHYYEGRRVESSEVPSNQSPSAWSRVTSRHEWAHSGLPFNDERNAMTDEVVSPSEVPMDTKGAG